MPLPPQIQIGQFISDPAKIQMPLEHATVQEIHAGTNGRLIIHIQDAHANLSGQQSLAKALDQLMTRYDLRLVLVEGSSRDASLDEIRKLAPLKEWSVIARRFLYEGIISGEEYLNLTTEHPMKIVGVEYRDLYDEAVKAYAAIVDRRKDILHYLYQAKVSLDRLKVRMYPKELKDYEARRGPDDGAGQIDFKTGFSDLLELAERAEYPLAGLDQVHKLKELMARESLIDFGKADVEQQAILKGLSVAGAEAEAREFAEASRRLRYSQVSQYLLVRRLLATASDRQVPIQNFPELVSYAGYLERFTDLDMEQLMTQIEYLEDKVYEKLLPSDDARKVRSIDRFLGLLGNAYKLQMSSHDFGMFTFNEKDFKTEGWLAFMNRQLVDLGFFESLVPYKPYLEEARADFGRFYRLVGERDLAFMENANRIMAERRENAAVLIAGGYHTAHLTKLLREEGTSYIVLTPVVTDTTDHARYEELLLSHLKEQEKRLASTRRDTGAQKAQNVAATRIPRGIRDLDAITAEVFGARLAGDLGEFVDSRARGLRRRMDEVAGRLLQQNPETYSPYESRAGEADDPVSQKPIAGARMAVEIWGSLIEEDFLDEELSELGRMVPDADARARLLELMLREIFPNEGSPRFDDPVLGLFIGDLYEHGSDLIAESHYGTLLDHVNSAASGIDLRDNDLGSLTDVLNAIADKIDRTPRRISADSMSGIVDLFRVPIIDGLIGMTVDYHEFASRLQMGQNSIDPWIEFIRARIDAQASGDERGGSAARLAVAEAAITPSGPAAGRAGYDAAWGLIPTTAQRFPEGPAVSAEGIGSFLPAQVTSRLTGPVPVATADGSRMAIVLPGQRADSRAGADADPGALYQQVFSRLSEFFKSLPDLLASQGLKPQVRPVKVVHVVLADGLEGIGRAENTALISEIGKGADLRVLSESGDAFGGAEVLSADDLTRQIADADANVIFNLIGSVEQIQETHEQLAAASPLLLAKVVRAPVSTDKAAPVIDLAGAVMIGELLAPVKDDFNASDAREGDVAKAVIQARDLGMTLGPRIQSALTGTGLALLFSDLERSELTQVDYLAVLRRAALKPFPSIHELIDQVAAAARMASISA